MSGKTSPVDPAEYIKKPDAEKDGHNSAAAEEPEPVRFSPEEEAVSTDLLYETSPRVWLVRSS